MKSKISNRPDTMANGRTCKYEKLFQSHKIKSLDFILMLPARNSLGCVEQLLECFPLLGRDAHLQYAVSVLADILLNTRLL